MNSRFRARLARFAGRRWKALVISVVILFEVAAIAIVATNAWVETVSSIKITNEANTKLEVDSYVYTDVTIGNAHGDIDLAKYFKQSGDMHLAPASSADGDRFFFPNAGGATLYRKGDTSDKNTAYLSATFRLKADANADFFFDQTPTVNNNIRVSVTAYSEGTSDLYDHTTGAPLYTKIYANTATTAAVVNSTSGGTGATSVEAFSDHIKGKSSTARLFAVGANETKIVTINVWLQKVSTDMNSVMSASQAITNLGITSSLTPRHVTLIPTPTWDISSAQNQTFYAWCWMSTDNSKHELYKLTSDANEHYSFDYNGTYDRTLFFRCGNPNLETSDMTGNWNSLGLWNKTADTSIPNDPIDPTYIIETISGGAHDNDINGNKSTGSWHDPATITVATVTDQSSWGAVSATSYIGTDTSSHVMEQTNTNNPPTVHTNTVHAWPGKTITLKAEPATNYAFVGWYTNEAGTGTAASTSATFTTTAPSTASEVTYYAKFKEVRTLTIEKYLDGVKSSAAYGTITIDGTTSGSGVDSLSKTFDKGSSVEFSATAATGYTLSGIYTTSTGNTEATSPVTLNANTTYYARFTTNSYNVTANAYYSTDGGSSYTAGSTGGTVKAGSSAAGATSTASVKYNSTVTLVASAASGYEFAGWYSAASGGSQLSTSSTYTYTLNTAGNVNVYARFKQMKTTTIYMTYRGYSKMRIYVWGKTTGQEYNGAFPGATVPTYTGNRGLYSYTFQTGNDEDIGIIVSDNGSESVRNEYTAHIGNTCLIAHSGSTINTNFSLGTKRYVYFTKNWTNNYIHYWGGSIASSTWPGTNMTNKAYTNNMNQDVLYFVINTGNTAVIFHNNSGTQTGDTTLGNNSCFYFNGANSAAGTWSPPTD